MTYFDGQFRLRVDKLLKALASQSREFEVLLVCNRKSSPLLGADFPFHSMTSEFLSDNEMDHILGSLRTFGLFVSATFSDAEFYEAILPQNRKRCVVFGLDPSAVGPSGKLLIAAVAQAKNLILTSSSPYATGLARHKFHWSLMLSQLAVSIPEIWCYSESAGWIGKREPSQGKVVLLQPAAASASIGVGDDSKQIVDEQITSRAKSLATTFRQDVIAREFISGFEVECPVITLGRAHALPPIGISVNGEYNLGGTYLQYNTVYSDSYGFYSFSDILPEQAVALQRTAEMVSEAIGLRGVSRIDFRIDAAGRAYVIDVAAHPHVIQHSTFAHAANAIGLAAESLPPLMIALALYDAGLLQPSDQC